MCRDHVEPLRDILADAMLCAALPEGIRKDRRPMSISRCRLDQTVSSAVVPRRLSKASATFKQSDLTRVLKAAKAAGIKLARVEVSQDGKIVMVPGEPEEAAIEAGAGANEWDSPR
jgi:hypothetical protein